MRSVTFIHAADLHLGAPFKGLRAVSAQWADTMLAAIPAAFNRIIDVAIEHQVDFMVIAGDVFDDTRPSYADFSLFVSGMQRLNEAGIPVYFINGNHDPYTSWNNDFAMLPPNTHLLGVDGPGFACFERDGQPLALIGGRSYFNQAWPAGVDVSDGISRETAISYLGKQAPFMIGVLHTGLDIDPTRSPARPADLMARDVDYWACGHIHQGRLLPSDEDPKIAFAGSPQGRGTWETGRHGILEVTLEEGASNKARFISTAQVEWQRLWVDVSACRTVADIQREVVSAQFAANADSGCQRMVFRIILQGCTPLYSSFTPRVLEDLRTAINDSYPFFFIDAIANETSAPRDKEALRNEGLFPAAFLGAVSSFASDADQSVSAVESEFTARGLAVPKGLASAMGKASSEAEELVLDLLSEEASR